METATKIRICLAGFVVFMTDKTFYILGGKHMILEGGKMLCQLFLDILLEQV